MSDETIDTTFLLEDQLTPTLKSIDQALGRMNQHLASTGSLLRQLDGVRGAGLKETSKSASALGLEFGTMAAVAHKAIDELLEMGRAALDGGIDLTHYAIHAASFKRNMTAGFELMEGTTEKARDTYALVKRFSDKTPFEEQDVMKLFRGIRAAGFEVRTTQDIMAGIFDTAVLQNPDQQKQSIEQMTRGLLKMQSQGRATAESMEMLTEGAMGTPVNAMAIYKELAQMRGMASANAASSVRGLMSSGSISPAEVITAFLNAVQKGIDHGDPLGKATKTFGIDSYEGQLSTLRSRMLTLFEDIDISPLVRTLTRLNELLSTDSESGRALRQLANDIFGGLFRMAEEWLTKDNMEHALTALGEAIALAKSTVVDAKPAFDSFLAGLSAGFQSFDVAVKPASQSLEEFKKAMDGQNAAAWKDLGEALGLIAKAVIVVGKAFVWANHYGVIPMQDALAAVVGAPGLGVVLRAAGALVSARSTGGATGPTSGSLPAATPRAKDIGLEAGKGLASGLNDATATVNVAAEALAMQAIDTTAQTLDIHSPSRVMWKLGRFAGEGFGGGVRESGGDAALADLLDMPARPALENRGSRGMGVHVSVQFGDIIIGDGVTAARAAHDIRASLEVEVISLFERLELLD